MVETYTEPEVHEPPIQVAGRFLAVVVFLVGIAMLGLAFSLAYKAFNNTEMLIPMRALSRVPPPSLIEVCLPTGLKLILLFAMGYIGSLVASRGAHLFFSAKRGARRASADD
jgi:hypothetical protein